MNSDINLVDLKEALELGLSFHDIANLLDMLSSTLYIFFTKNYKDIWQETTPQEKYISWSFKCLKKFVLENFSIQSLTPKEIQFFEIQNRVLDVTCIDVVTINPIDIWKFYDTPNLPKRYLDCEFEIILSKDEFNYYSQIKNQSYYSSTYSTVKMTAREYLKV